MSFLVGKMEEISASALAYDPEQRVFYDDRAHLEELAGAEVPGTPKHWILGAGAVVGGFAIGAAAAESMREGFIAETIPADQSTGEAVLAFSFGCLGMVLFAGVLMETVEQYGIKTVGAVMVGAPALALGIRAIRG